MKTAARISIALVMVAAWTAGSGQAVAEGQSISNVNGSVRASAGETYDSLSTVNGDVRLGRGATATEARTVNGEIVLEGETRVGTVRTVNGSLEIGEGAAVSGAASTVNGSVTVEKRARVGGELTTVSGDIEVRGGEVTGKVVTHNGDIELTDGAVLHGGIHVKKNKSFWGNGDDRPIRVYVCATCVVEGELRFERPAELRVDQGGRIGTVIGESVTRR